MGGKGTRGQNKTVGKLPEGRTRQWERHQRAEKDNEKGTRGQNKTMGKASEGRTRQWDRHQRAELDNGKGTRGQKRQWEITSFMPCSCFQKEHCFL